MRSHTIRRRRTRSLSVPVPRVERRYRAGIRVTPLRRYSDASRSATRVRSRTLTAPSVEVPVLPLPSPVHVLPRSDAFARRVPRTQVMSGQALARPAVTPTVNLRALYYARPDVMVCVRRKQRKEVLFAKGRAGGNHKKPRFTEESKYICY